MPAAATGAADAATGGLRARPSCGDSDTGSQRGGDAVDKVDPSDVALQSRDGQLALGDHLASQAGHHAQSTYFTLQRQRLSVVANDLSLDVGGGLSTGVRHDAQSQSYRRHPCRRPQQRLSELEAFLYLGG